MIDIIYAVVFCVLIVVCISVWWLLKKANKKIDIMLISIFNNDITIKCLRQDLAEAQRKLSQWQQPQKSSGVLGAVDYPAMVAAAKAEAQNAMKSASNYKRLYEEAVQKATCGQFTREELNALISLCHPDKHGGKVSAGVMTAKLLELRG